MKHTLSILATVLVIVSCSENGSNSPDSPTPVNPSPKDTEVVANRYYFTQAYVGLFAGESAETELRFQGKKYDLASNKDQISFTSDDPSVATVDANGKITALKVGHTTVTATDKNKSYTDISVRVYPEGFLKYKSPAGDEVPIHAWFAKISTLSQFNILRQCGFNMAGITYSLRDEFDLLLTYAQSAKIKLVLAGLDPSTHIENKGLGMYFTTDEPRPDEETLNTIKQAIEYYNKIDPNHPCYVNFTPKDTDTFIRYLDLMPLNFLSYDYYPILSYKLKEDHFSNMSEARKAANTMAVPLWGFTNSVEHGAYPTPTIEHLRFQLFTDMVYGAQGYQFFTYTVPVGADADMEYIIAPIGKDGQQTQIWYDCQTVIGEIKNYMKFLFGAQNIWIMGNVDSSLEAYNKNNLPFPLTEVNSSNQYIISHSVNDGHEYLLVFNPDYKQSRTVNLKFSQSVERIGDNASLSSVTGSTAVNLSPGNIAVFKLN